jgi:LPXTG-motif cell wall-anchored protein
MAVPICTSQKGVRVKATPLSRRLLACAAGLAIGVGGILAVAAPAQAVAEEVPDKEPIEVTQPTCEDDKGYIVIPDHKGILINYLLDGEDVDPGAVEVGPGNYQVTKETRHSIRASWSVQETWDIKINAARDCEDEDEEKEREGKKLIKEPTFTPPTCEDANGYIEIPAAGHIELFVYSINGEPVERGETYSVFSPGSYTVEVHGKFTKKPWKSFHYDFEPADCPGEEEEENGGGGELPETGAPTALVAGGALLLLTLGGAMYVVARRRRITFTA